MPKLKEDKEKFLKEIVPQWLQQAKQREAKYGVQQVSMAK